LLETHSISRQHRWRHRNSGRTIIVGIPQSHSQLPQVAKVSHDKDFDVVLSATLNSSGARPIQRLFIVEDLCSTVIETLWKHFPSLDPALFISHLHGSGCGGPAPMNLIPPKSLRIQNYLASFQTVRWVRVGECFPHAFKLKGNRDFREFASYGDLMQPFDSNDIPLERRDRPLISGQNSFDRVKVTSNILRNCETFAVGENDGGYGDRVPCLWEESATLRVDEHYDDQSTDGKYNASLQTLSQGAR
jgi:hypothetical protein